MERLGLCFNNLIKRYPQLSPCFHQLNRVVEILRISFENYGKLLIAGNGGSAADADHMSAELLKKFCKNRPIPQSILDHLPQEISSHLEGGLPAIPLANFIAFHTAYANDRAAESSFAQLVSALGMPHDVLFAISTSGNSKNILHAIEVARAKNIPVIGLSGRSGGQMSPLCTECICVPEEKTFKIQELHLPIYHAICQTLEECFF